MPALSKKQQKFMGIVRSIQKGEQPAGKFSKDAQDAAKSMRKSSVKKYAATKHKGKPEKVKSEAKERDYKKEYKKFQSSTKAKKYRAELNKYNRQKGTYGNGDGKDASHKGGKIVGFESQSKNRGRAEKSRLKKEQSYRYGSGDIVKDVNPSCPHHGAMGKVKSVNPKSVVFVVMNKGKNFKPGMELEKSHDQMKKMNESINEMSAKSKKLINKLGKKEKDVLMSMIDMMGFDQVMSDYKRDKKAFKQALKDMSENINEKKKKMFPPDKMTPKQAKEYKRFIDYAKMGIEYKIDMSLFESINEDGHTDVASSKRKVMIMVQDSNKLLNKLNGMNTEDSLPSWWTDKITLSQNYLQKATNYLLNPTESVNEGKGVEKVLKMANDQSFGKLGGRTVDALSAGLFKGVYEKAPQNAKDKINKMNEKQLYVFMTKLWSKFGKQVRLGS